MTGRVFDKNPQEGCGFECRKLHDEVPKAGAATVACRCGIGYLHRVLALGPAEYLGLKHLPSTRKSPVSCIFCTDDSSTKVDMKDTYDAEASTL